MLATLSASLIPVMLVEQLTIGYTYVIHNAVHGSHENTNTYTFQLHRDIRRHCGMEPMHTH